MTKLDLKFINITSNLFGDQVWLCVARPDIVTIKAIEVWQQGVVYLLYHRQSWIAILFPLAIGIVVVIKSRM